MIPMRVSVTLAGMMYGWYGRDVVFGLDVAQLFVLFVTKRRHYNYIFLY